MKTVDKMQESEQRTQAFEDYFNTFFKALELPQGFALRAVKSNGLCGGCYFTKKGAGDCLKIFLPCQAKDRKDGKNVIFKKVKING